METKEQLRKEVEKNLDSIVKDINGALSGATIREYEPILRRLGRRGSLPHWYEHLAKDHVLPNLDGKTVGSIVEMLLVAVLEKRLIEKYKISPLRINPARGIDLPDLELGVKSPSENYCTSEPFYSAYERLIGSEYDAVILLTDYQTAKTHPPLRLKIIKWKYLRNTEIADSKLCGLAKKHRDWLLSENEAWTQKLFRFLAYVNQSDWRAKNILRLMAFLDDKARLLEELDKIASEFEEKNRDLISRDIEPIPQEELEKIMAIRKIEPTFLGVLDVADNWVVDAQKESGRMPNDNELHRLKTGPLDGKIGMSFALQWRYNFGKLFGLLG